MTALDRTDLREYARRATLAIIALVLILVTSAYGMALAQTTAAAQGQQPPVHHIFTPGYAAKAMPMHGALQASVHTFKAEDGTPLYQSDDWYKSANDARSALGTLTKKAARVIKQGTKKDAKGGVVGKRVELVLSSGHKASAEMVIAWTDGATVVRLRSTSLPLLLDFESQYYP